MKKKGKILKKRGDWNFGKKVPNNFVPHITKSVPFYLQGHDVIKFASDFFLKNNSTCYDIGCSTAELLLKLSNFSNKKVQFIGTDSEKAMVKFSRELLKKKKIKNIVIKNEDITRMNLNKSDMVISYYTIQFIAPKFRQIVIKKIFNSLNWGGAFFFFEKIRGADARFQDILTSLYNDFKESNGITIKEIDNKQKSLRGVLEPFSEKGNLDMLKRAGFKDIMPIFQYLNFKGYLCIK